MGAGGAGAGEQVAVLEGLVGWFDVDFAPPHASSSSFQRLHPITLSTSPWAPRTHWRQSIFPFSHPIKVRSGDIVSGEFVITQVPAPQGESSIRGREYNVDVTAMVIQGQRLAVFSEHFELR
eukprot:g12207.t1